MTHYSDILNQLQSTGNYREIPADGDFRGIDFSTNDYMGLGNDRELQKQFFDNVDNRAIPMTSSASRLLASRQHEHEALERLLSDLYGRSTLLFNSGYHANTGIISALADSGTYIVADKLVHASIIDGIVLSRAPFTRFRHNDYDHLEKILQRIADSHERILVITESIFSMDGDAADIDRLTDIKRRFNNVILYIDEAHAFGAAGHRGLGLSRDNANYNDVDIIVGTFGKAAASSGAFAAVDSTIKNFLINRSRSFIFSTALSPMTCAWTSFVIERLVTMDAERDRLAKLGKHFAEKLSAISAKPVVESHIIPFIVGDASLTVDMSLQLRALGYKVLPIRTPTVPAGTERLRFSLSASMDVSDIDGVVNAIKSIME